MHDLRRKKALSPGFVFILHICDYVKIRVTAYVPGFGLFFRPELNLRATLAKPSGLHG